MLADNYKTSLKAGAEGQIIMAFWLILVVIALLALAMVSSWRDPKNWGAHAESGTLRYTAWVELSIFGVMVAMVSLCSLLFIG